jgi:hypothetical protein
MGETKEEVDLSHYDLRDTFVIREAARLIAGVDPYAHSDDEWQGTALAARIFEIEQAMSRAVDRADAELTFMHVGPDVPHDQVYPPWYQSDEDGNLPKVLPSTEMWTAFRRYRYSRDTAALFTEIDYEKDEFRREDITVWLQRVNYKGASYFLPKGAQPDSSEQAQITQLKAEIARLQSELEKARASQCAPLLVHDGALKFRHETRLLGLVWAVQERFAGNNLDISDRDTWQAQMDVINWLMEQEPGMSKATATAIDRIAMPFSRGK